MNRLMLFLLLTLSLCALGAAPAMAGTYTVEYPASGTLGWSKQQNMSAPQGHYLCLAAICGLGNHSYANAAGSGYGVWQKAIAHMKLTSDDGSAAVRDTMPAGTYGAVRWAPPAGTSLARADLTWVSAQANSSVKTISIRNFAMSVALTDTAGKTHTDTVSGSRSFTTGVESGISMNMDQTATSDMKNMSANNGFTITSAKFTIQDNKAPLIDLVSAPGWGANGGWITDGSTKCVTASGGDVGSGVVSASLWANEQQLASAAYKSGNAYTPGLLESKTFQPCLNTATAPEGILNTDLYFDDAAGNYTGRSLGPIRIARTHPKFKPWLTPAETSTIRRPSFQFDIDYGVSGVQSSALYIDGVVYSQAQDADRHDFAVKSDLALGSHTWKLTAVSAAGLSSELAGTFRIVSPGTVVAPLRLVAPASVKIANGRATIRVRVMRGTRPVLGARVSCRIGQRVVARVRTNSRGAAYCRLRARRDLKVTVRAGTKSKVVLVKRR
jgi:hypothetical protein